MKEKEKDTTKNNLYIAKAVAEILNLNITYQKKQKKQQQQHQKNNKIKYYDNDDDDVEDDL